MNMMVDKTGKPYAITVVNSAGSPEFEAPAKRWMTNQTFKPAKLNGVAVETTNNFKVIFSLGGGDGAFSAFRKGYKTVREAVNNDDRAAAEATLKSLKSLKVQTLYEDAFYNLIRYYFLHRWGTKEEQLQAITAAIAHETTGRYLPRNAFRAAVRAQFLLQV